MAGKPDLRDEFNRLDPSHIFNFQVDFDDVYSFLNSYIKLIPEIRALLTLGGVAYDNFMGEKGDDILGMGPALPFGCFCVNIEVKWGCESERDTCTLVFLKSNLYLVAWGTPGAMYEFKESPVTFRFTVATGIKMSYSEFDEFPFINGQQFLQAVRAVAFYQVGRGGGADVIITKYLRFFMWILAECVRFNRIFHRTSTAFRPCPGKNADSSYDWMSRECERNKFDIELVNSWETLSQAIVNKIVLCTVLLCKIGLVKTWVLPIQFGEIIGVLARV